MTGNDKHAGAVLTIDLDAIRDNYRLLRTKAGRAACAAAVKADAYGLGAACNDPDFFRGIALRYLMSHLACAERQDHPMNMRQLAAFNEARSRQADVPRVVRA